MKHLAISDYGSFLGLDANCLLVRKKDEKQRYPLNRLSTISIVKRGVSISSDLLEVLSARGIKLFFLDFRGVPYAALLGEAQHGVVAVRQAQHEYCKNNNLDLAIHLITGKIKNQRAVLNHFNKYHKNSALEQASEKLQANCQLLGQCGDRNQLLGFEGNSAAIYFQALREGQLFSKSFLKREGRGSREINNSLLNLGYAVLSSYLLNAIVNAGLEPYLGLLHEKRIGRMGLVLDLMEEYRAWVVDRAVIKLRQQSRHLEQINQQVKKTLIENIQKTCRTKYAYKKKKVKLEHIIQRQVYRLCGHFYGEKIYRPFLFKW